MQGLATRFAQALETAKILDKPEHKLFMEAGKFATERGYGRVPGTDTQVRIDASSLTDEQLERIRAGEDWADVLATSVPGGVRTGAEAAEGTLAGDGDADEDGA